MTSRPSSTARALRRAFTIIEVILVVALLSLVGALFISATAGLIRAREPDHRDAFWLSLNDARQLALGSGQPVRLSFDTEKKIFKWANGAGGGQRAFTGEKAELLSANTESQILLGGVLTESTTLPFVRIYPDGACDTFRVQIALTGGARQILQVDPWTCAPVLPVPR